MLNYIKNKFRNYWDVGHERSLTIKRNIIYSFLIKGCSILIGFILVPITIYYLNSSQYGLWLTIYSVVAWVNTFDIGLSNGLRNKLANSIALNQNENAIKYISTTYALLFLIAIIVFVLFGIVSSLINWNNLLTINAGYSTSIWQLIIITLGFLCLQFALQPINSILTALQQSSKSSVILLIGQLFTLLFTGLLSVYTKGNIIYLAIVAAGCPVAALLISNIYLFKTKLKHLAPKFSSIEFTSAKSLLNIGGTFFFIQIGALILYETDNIVIAHTMAPAQVTTFNIAFKYFSVLTIAFNIIITPYWSAFTDAFAKRDFEWMHQSIKRLHKTWMLFFIATIFAFLGANSFYKIWIGGKTTIPLLLSFAIAVYVIIQNWMLIYAYMLNGTGKLKVQLILVVSTGVINIPLSILLIKHIGIAGTTFANIIVMLLMSCILTYQGNVIIKNKAKGIWNK